MSKLSPTEVLSKIAKDLRQFGISHEDAAEGLGYKNKQSVTNILNSKSDKYMAPEQAKRFHDAFGYDIYALLTGEGDLTFNPPVSLKAFSSRGEAKGFEVTDGGLSKDDEINLLTQWVKAFAALSGDPRAMAICEIYDTQIHGKKNSELAFGIIQSSNILQSMLVDRYDQNSTAANTDPVTVKFRE